MNSEICVECGYEYTGRMCTCTWKHESINGRHRLSSIDDFDDNLIRPLLDYMGESIDNRNILFLGPSGTGKTHCATALAKYIAIKERTDDIKSIKRLSKLPSEFETQMKAVDNTKILIINEFNSDMFFLLDDRIENEKELYTICTSNMRYEDIDKRFLWRLKIVIFDTESLTIEEVNKLSKDKIKRYNDWVTYIEQRDNEEIYDTVSNDTWISLEDLDEFNV